MIFDKTQTIKVKFKNGRQVYVSSISPAKKKELVDRFKSEILSITGAAERTAGKSASKSAKRPAKKGKSGAAWHNDHYNINKDEKYEVPLKDRKREVRNRPTKKFETGGGVGGKITDADVKKLYDEAMELFNQYYENDGTLEYSDKEYGYLNDALDEVAVGYFENAPDGTYQEELENEGFKLSAEEAYDILDHRIKMIREELDEFKKGGSVKKKAEKGAKVGGEDFTKNGNDYLHKSGYSLKLYYKAGDEDDYGDTFSEDQFIVLDNEGMDVAGEYMTLSEAKQTLLDSLEHDDDDEYKTGGKTGRKRRTKAEMQQARWADHVKAYKFFIVDLENKRAIDGYEFKEDAQETLESDYGKYPKEQQTHKVIAERSLAAAGVENPKDRWMKMKAGGKTGSKKYSVWNWTDNISATAKTFSSKKAANDFIKEFRDRYKQQGYYRDNRWRKIAPEDIELEVYEIND